MHRYIWVKLKQQKRQFIQNCHTIYQTKSILHHLSDRPTLLVLKVLKSKTALNFTTFRHMLVVWTWIWDQFNSLFFIKIPGKGWKLDLCEGNVGAAIFLNLTIVECLNMIYSDTTQVHEAHLDIFQLLSDNLLHLRSHINIFISDKSTKALISERGIKGPEHIWQLNRSCTNSTSPTQTQPSTSSFSSLLSWLQSKATLLQGLSSRAPTLLFNMVDWSVPNELQWSMIKRRKPSLNN